MTDKELYDLAKAGDPACIPGLLDMLSFAALEILRLEGERDKYKLKWGKLPAKQLAEFMRTYRGHAQAKQI